MEFFTIKPYPAPLFMDILLPSKIGNMRKTQRDVYSRRLKKWSWVLNGMSSLRVA